MRAMCTDHYAGESESGGPGEGPEKGLSGRDEDLSRPEEVNHVVSRRGSSGGPDPVALIEIDLYGDLMIAASSADEDRLSPDRIDEVLRVVPRVSDAEGG
ncbi:hypothetical protein AF335_10480 [Streptomyces eurocidicus]|uniref:Uncharacterized protein n=1 Tax=Streptomyces eurocidicus TaxID=66423 RepID=A0A2N8NX32_STREU|nr:hypothetical protein AF335_10480 [Streptomyces eurocidicus]